MSSELQSKDLSRFNCWLILIVAFLGWGFAGMHMAITSIVMRVATTDLMPAGTSEAEIGHLAVDPMSNLAVERETWGSRLGFLLASAGSANNSM